MFLEIILGSFILALFLFHYHIRYGRIAKYIDQIPGPFSLPLIGNTFDFVKIPYGEFQNKFYKIN